MGWIIFGVIVIPVLAVFVWMLLDDSFVYIDPGQQGLLLLKGRATDTTVGPGLHWVPALRRRTIETYPAVELSLRVGDGALANAPVGELEQTASSTAVCLADRTRGTVGYLLRFRLDLEHLPTIHNRFSVNGFWSATRDLSQSTIAAALAVREVDALFGPRRAELEEQVTEALRAELGPAGIVVTLFRLTDVDLGRTSAVMEATARARHELDREHAESAMRVARAEIDATLAPFAGAGSDVALRYREVDSWRELARTANVVVPVPPRAPAEPTTEPEPTTPATQEAG